MNSAKQRGKGAPKKKRTKEGKGSICTRYLGGGYAANVCPARIEKVQQREEEGCACGVRCFGWWRTWLMDIAWAFRASKRSAEVCMLEVLYSI